MGTFKLDGIVKSIDPAAKAVAVPDMLVDTGSELTWIPAHSLKLAKVAVAKKQVVFVLADGSRVARSTGYAILRMGKFETVDEVVFAQPGDITILGARTLEGFGANVDPRKKRLVASSHLAAPSP